MLRISFINVGYGEAILLEDVEPGKAPFVLLIDGGSAEPEEYEGGTGRIRAAEYLAKRGISHLDRAVITHPHEDHVPGL
jgi:beta-lactamase superfamily II metal-dependent hydrolase